MSERSICSTTAPLCAEILHDMAVPILRRLGRWAGPMHKVTRLSNDPSEWDAGGGRAIHKKPIMAQ